MTRSVIRFRGVAVPIKNLARPDALTLIHKPPPIARRGEGNERRYKPASNPAGIPVRSDAFWRVCCCFGVFRSFLSPCIVDETIRGIIIRYYQKFANGSLSALDDSSGVYTLLSSS